VIQTFVFYLFATIVIASGAMTIVARNPVHSVLWLILAFFNAAGLMLLVGAEFLAFLLIIVYVGAVAVLFLFVVMMLDVDFAAMRASFARYWPLGTLLALILLAEIVFALLAWAAGGVMPETQVAPIDPEIPNIEALGTVLYTRYIFAFLASSIILLVAMVGAIVLTHRARGGTRPQRISDQVRRRPEEAVRKINQPSGQGVEL
jgi:NADH-quinone oxidoreductase subunit J